MEDQCEENAGDPSLARLPKAAVHGGNIDGGRLAADHSIRHGLYTKVAFAALSDMRRLGKEKIDIRMLNVLADTGRGADRLGQIERQKGMVAHRCTADRVSLPRPLYQCSLVDLIVRVLYVMPRRRDAREEGRRDVVLPQIRHHLRVPVGHGVEDGDLDGAAVQRPALGLR